MHKTDLINKRVFKKVDKPKIFIITPVYNKEGTIKRIQNQYFDQIEIILVDDKSTVNSVIIIEGIKEENQKIIL